MKKILKFVERQMSLIILLMGLMILIMFVRTCGMNRDMENHNENIEIKISELDSAINVTTDKVNAIDITEAQVEKLFKDNMWYFLELEELADKQNVSILELKHNRNKDEE